MRYGSRSQRRLCWNGNFVRAKLESTKERPTEPSRGVSHPLSWSGNDAQSRIDHGLSQMDERSAEGPDRC